MRILISCVLPLILATLFEARPAAAQQPGEEQGGPPSLVVRVRDTGFVQLRADSFNDLSPEQKMDAYWLSRAAIDVDDIAYDQNSPFGLREKRLLEAILTHADGIDPAVLKKITEFTMLFWGNHGSYNDFTSRKFVPDFTPAELRSAAQQALQNGAQFGGDVNSAAALDHELQDLEKPLFDPDFKAMLVVKNPPNGEDPLEASGNNFYSGVRLKDLAGFTERYALNSRLVKEDGKLLEQVYRAGTPVGPGGKAVPAGLYAPELGHAIEDLQRAAPYASESQKKVIQNLIRYYQTGERAAWIECGVDWVQDKSNPDFSNGFVEVYKDARGQKGAIQGFVVVVDEKMNQLMTGFAANAAYFEQRAPWDAKYKNPNPHPPIVNADEALVETGDFGVTTIGDNLPNEAEIHEKYGSKSFIFTGSIRALNDALGHKVAEEFANSQAEAERARKYGDLAENLFTAMHEVIGHGSGKLSDRLSGGAQPFLKEYFSTLEEGRADLMALWNVWDPKLKELGLITNQEEVAEAMYDNAAAVALTQLRRIQHGDTIEEDHERDRQLIAHYIADQVPGSIEQFQRDGKTYVRVADYEKMRKGVGMLLAELMRIKAEGDYDAIKALVEKYGVHFDPKVRDEVMARYQKLNLPTYFAGVNARLTAKFGKDGEIEIVEIGEPGDVTTQYLEYGAMFDEGLRRAPDHP